MKTIKQLLSIIAPVSGLMALAAFFNVLTIGSNIGLLATSAYLIATASLQPPLSALAAAITGVRFFGLSRAVFRYGERYTGHWATFQILCELRAWFYTKLEPLAPARLSGYQSGDLLGRIVSDVDTLQFFYLRVIAPPFSAFIILIFMGYWLAYFSISLTMLLVTSFILLGLAAPFFISKKARNIAQERIVTRAAVKAQIIDSLDGLTELTAFNQTGRQLDKLAQVNRRLTGFNLRKARLNASADVLIGLIMNLTVWGTLFLSIPLAGQGLFDKVWLAVIVIAVQASFEAVLPLPLAGYYLDESLAAGRRLFSVAETVPAVAETGNAALLPDNFTLKVSNLSFAYEGASSQALSNISFELKPNARLAIVGPSGAGKSSFANILCRFFEYDKGNDKEIPKGKITLGDYDLKDYHPDNLRRYFAVVSQDDYLFNSSVEDNILLARPSATSQEFQATIKTAGLESFIESLPEGTGALVGTGGKLLSGGERRRLAIARALLKDAPILILDEPTAGLDALTAQKIMSDIYKHMAGRSIILITHDLNYLETVDEILVLDQGCIVERGTLPELLKSDGLFAAMSRLQKDIF